MYSVRNFLRDNLPERARKKRSLRPRVGIRLWLTALFVLVTAFAVSAAYAVVQPILYNSLDQASEAAFRQVGDQYLGLLNRNDGNISVRQIQSFAASRDVQWGIVRGGTQLQGTLEDWNNNVAQRAVATQQPSYHRGYIPTGVRAGQLLATYAVPINDEQGRAGQAVVFVQFFAESDDENVRSAIKRINRVVLMAGAVALLISGFAGYVAADLIARRVRRLGVVAERLAGGNFEERIESRIEDEVGSLGATFNSMAESLRVAFGRIEQEKERGQAILDGMTDAVVGVDRELNAIFLNPRAKELLDSADPDFHERLQEVLAKSRYSGPLTEPEARVETEAGERIIEIRAAPLEEGALAILRDVTDQRRIERAKTEFIANASHELKTPLTSLSGYLEMLEDEGDEETRAAFLDDMRLQTKRLQSLAQILLDLSRLDANAVVFKSEAVDLEDLLYGLRRDFGYTGRPMNINVEEEAPPVETDAAQLHRMLAILVDNALKYSDEGSPVDIGLRSQDGRVLISVSDRGCGIPEGELPYIFERFYRAQGSSRAGGTGLGLSLAREISEHLGGGIRVDSRPGSGSIFTVSLPISEKVSTGPSRIGN